MLAYPNALSLILTYMCSYVLQNKILFLLQFKFLKLEVSETVNYFARQQTFISLDAFAFIARVEVLRIIINHCRTNYKVASYVLKLLIMMTCCNEVKNHIGNYLQQNIHWCEHIRLTAFIFKQYNWNIYNCYSLSIFNNPDFMKQ